MTKHPALRFLFICEHFMVNIYRKPLHLTLRVLALEEPQRAISGSTMTPRQEEQLRGGVFIVVLLCMGPSGVFPSSQPEGKKQQLEELDKYKDIPSCIRYG